MATMMMTGPPMMFGYLVYAVVRRFCGCCPGNATADEEKPLPEESPEKQEGAEQKKEPHETVTFLPGGMTEGKDGENNYIIVLDGLTKKKLLEGELGSPLWPRKADGVKNEHYTVNRQHSFL